MPEVMYGVVDGVEDDRRPISVDGTGAVKIAGGGGGGGGATTIADGADVNAGSTADLASAATQSGKLRKIADASGLPADAAYASGSGTLVSILKGIFGKIPGLGSSTSAAALPVVIATDQVAVASKAASASYVDGSIVNLGAAADAAYASGSGTIISILKGIFTRVGFVNTRILQANTSITIPTAGTTPVNGTAALTAADAIAGCLSTPVSFEGTEISFQVGPASTGPWVVLKDRYGADVKITGVAASLIYSIPKEVFDSCQFFKPVSNVTAGANRIISFWFKR